MARPRLGRIAVGKVSQPANIHRNGRLGNLLPRLVRSGKVAFRAAHPNISRMAGNHTGCKGGWLVE